MFGRTSNKSKGPSSKPPHHHNVLISLDPESKRYFSKDSSKLLIVKWSWVVCLLDSSTFIPDDVCTI